MASGKTHSTVSFISGSFLSIAVSFFTNKTDVSLGVFWGFFLQVFMSPDMDINSSNISQKYLRENSFVLAYWWRTLWKPYALSMSHRGKSHTVYSTLVRLIYLFIPFVVMFSFISDNKTTHGLKMAYLCLVSQIAAAPIFIAFYLYMKYSGNTHFLLALVVSVWAGDMLHLCFDGLWGRFLARGKH